MKQKKVQEAAIHVADQKQEAADYLKGIGYNAEVVKGVLVIWVPEPMRPGKKNRLRNTLRAIGYRGSWGWRMPGVAANEC